MCGRLPIVALCDGTGWPHPAGGGRFGEQFGVAADVLEPGVVRSAGDAEEPGVGEGPTAAMRLIDGLRAWSADLVQAYPDPCMGDPAGLYNVNVGRLSTGDWPSSVPAVTRLRLRVGFPRAWTPDRAIEEVRAVVHRITEAVGPSIRATVCPSGFRAPGYLLDQPHPLTEILGDAHESAHGGRPQMLGFAGTTDARIYLEYFGVPAACYGPNAGNIHGVDEWVDLDTIIAGARTLTRFIAGWYASAGRQAP